MKELLYTILELEEWNRETVCDFCPSSVDSKAVCQIRTRNKITQKIAANACACESCKEKFENDELLKCEKCGRLQTDLNLNYLSGKYICDCVRHKETQEKELPVLPGEERASTRYERQINSLREEKQKLTEEADTHLEALEIAEDWHKRQKQELLDRIKELEKKINICEEENKRLVRQLTELVPTKELIAQMEARK